VLVEVAVGNYKLFVCWCSCVVQDVFEVLTDRMHKSAFKSHCQIVGAMFQLLFSGRVTVPLFEPTASLPDMTNQRFVCEYLASVLAAAFPHIGLPRIQTFIMGIFPASVDESRLKNHVRDFLIEMKEFSEDDASELFNEEAALAAAAAANDELNRRKAVPGLLGSLAEDYDEL
jgi:exportin-1